MYGFRIWTEDGGSPCGGNTQGSGGVSLISPCPPVNQPFLVKPNTLYRIGKGVEPALEKSPLKDIEQIRMDQKYYFLSCSWNHHIQGDTWRFVSEFLSTTLKGNWVITGFDRSGYVTAQSSYSLLSSLLWDRTRTSIRHQFQLRILLTVDPLRVYRGTLGDTFITIVLLNCFVIFFYQWLKETRGLLTTFCNGSIMFPVWRKDTLGHECLLLFGNNKVMYTFLSLPLGILHALEGVCLQGLSMSWTELTPSCHVPLLSFLFAFHRATEKNCTHGIAG